MIKLSPFGGLSPRTGVRLLPDTGAQRAVNVKLQSGEIHPLRQPGSPYVPASPKTNPAMTVFKARNGTTSSAWFTWPIDVDCVRAPLAIDVESRFCWTGDGVPKMSTYTSAVSGGADNYPLLANEMTLGIPAPTGTATVTPSGGVGAAVSRIYCYTYVSALGEESAPSPLSLLTTGKVDDTWAIAAMGTAPLNTGSISSAAKETPAGYIELTTSVPHWLRTGDKVVITGIASGVTDANGTWTVQSTTTTSKFTILKTTAQTGATAGTWARSTPWNTTGMTKNLYRTAGSLAAFQLVNPTGIAVATTTYNDTLLDTQIAGDDLISSGWVPPPAGLIGLCVHSSGALCGFVNNLLCFSEPNQPHAWPTAYQLAAGYNGVGVAVFGSSVVMATAGPPYVAAGVEPASMSGEDVSGMYPCLSKRSVVSIGDSVLYASKFGLVSVGSQGVSVFTDPFYTRDEWEPLNPETMISETANGRVYVRYTDDASISEVLVFDGPLLSTVSASPTEMYADVSTGELYITTSAGVFLWDDPLKVVYSGDWRSREIVFPEPVNLGAAKVDFTIAVDPVLATAITAAIAAATAANAALIAAGDIGGTIGDEYLGEMEIGGSNLTLVPDLPASNEVTFNLYSGTSLMASRVISTTRAFRLPAGYKLDNYSVEVITQCRVKEIRVAETPDGLRDA